MCWRLENEDADSKLIYHFNLPHQKCPLQHTYTCMLLNFPSISILGVVRKIIGLWISCLHQLQVNFRAMHKVSGVLYRSINFYFAVILTFRSCVTSGLCTKINKAIANSEGGKGELLLLLLRYYFSTSTRLVASTYFNFLTKYKF